MRTRYLGDNKFAQQAPLLFSPSQHSATSLMDGKAKRGSWPRMPTWQSFEDWARRHTSILRRRSQQINWARPSQKLVPAGEGLALVLAAVARQAATKGGQRQVLQRLHKDELALPSRNVGALLIVTLS